MEKIDSDKVYYHRVGPKHDLHEKFIFKKYFPEGTKTNQIEKSDELHFISNEVIFWNYFFLCKNS